MKLAVLFMFAAFAAQAADTRQIGKSFEGRFDLYSGSGNCLQPSLDIKYRDDGNANNCVFNEGPRLTLGSNEVIKCLDNKDQHGVMDTYTCNFVWDAMTSTRQGINTITTREGRKCLIMPTRWSRIQTLSMQTNKILTIKTEDREGMSICNYRKR